MVTESKSHGWAPVVGSVMAGIGVTFAAVFIMMWIDAGDAKIASQRLLTIVAGVGMVAVAILILIVGVMLGQRGDRAMVSHVSGELGTAYRTIPPSTTELPASQTTLMGYRPAQQLQQPARIVNVPRYVVNGKSMPMGAPQPVELRTLSADGEELTIPLTLLMRFLSCSTPSRSEWTGKREAYSDALRRLPRRQDRKSVV